MIVYQILLPVVLTELVCASNLTVWQTPRNISVASGEAVIITCHFILQPPNAGQVKVQWFRNNDSINVTQTFNYSEDEGGGLNKSARLQLGPVDVGHSGVYHCKVTQDVPVLKQGREDQGTGLTVVPDHSGIITSITQHRAVILWTSGLITVCIMSATYILYRCRDMKGRQQTARQPVQDDVLYAQLNIPESQESRSTAAMHQTLGAETQTDVLYSDIRVKVI